MSHFGVHIYPEDYKEPERNFKYGDPLVGRVGFFYDETVAFQPLGDAGDIGARHQHYPADFAHPVLTIGRCVQHSEDIVLRKRQPIVSEYG